MAHFIRCIFSAFFRKGNTILLALFYLAGFSLGIICSAQIGENTFLSVGYAEVGTLFFALALPFLFSVYAVATSVRELLFLICFLKAFLFSFVSLHIMASYGEAGWIARTAVMLPEIFAIPALYFFWQRHLSQDIPIRTVDAIYILLIVSVIEWVSYHFIFPFSHFLLLQKG